MKLLRLAFLWFFLSASSLFADTHYVDLTGGNVAPYTTPATAAINPADAISAASTGDVVRIAAGTYAIPVPLQIDQLTLEGVTNVVLMGSGSDRVLVATNSTLAYLTIANGYIVDDAGAGAYVTNCTVRSCVFRRNEARTTFAGGFGSNSRGKGIGLYAVDSRVAASDFIGNTQEENQGCHLPHQQGGGAHFVRCEVQACRFLNNICDDGAGFWAADDTRITDSLVQGNRKHLGHPVVLDSSKMVDCTVTENTWGVWAKGVSSLTQCDIIDNVGDFGGYSFACVDKTPGGGGLYIQEFSFAARCRISGNSAGLGAGIMIGPSPGLGQPGLNNCLVTGNILQDSEFQDGKGAGIYFADSAGLSFLTFSDNVSTGTGAIVEIDGLGLNTTSFKDSIVWGNEGTTVGPGAPSSAFQFNILEGVTANQNFNVDPLLTAEYRLSPDSPAIDRADSFPIGPDFFREPRLIGMEPDIGADEFHPPMEITTAEVVSDDLTDLTFNTYPDTTYQFEFTPRLDPATWADSGGVVTSAAGTNATTVTMPMPGKLGMYRVRFAP